MPTTEPSPRAGRRTRTPRRPLTYAVVVGVAFGGAALALGLVALAR